MVRNIVLCCVVALGAGTYSWTQDGAKDSAKQMEMPKPGPEHEKFKEVEGQWDCEVNCTTMGKSTGTATFKVDFGGFYLVQDFKGTMGGQPYVGRGTCGYCPIKKKYISTWICSTCPTMAMFEGEYDSTGKVLTETGEMPGPDGKTMKMKNICTMKDKDTMVFSMNQVGADGKDTEMMSITYKRKA